MSVITKVAQKYIRIPIDVNIEDLLQKVRDNNPFFSDLDSIRFILGQFAIQNNYTTKGSTRLSNLLDQMSGIHKNVLKTPKMTDEQMFAALEKANL
jgi:translation initiation factor IF-3